MVEPYESVAVSKTSKYPRARTPSDGVAVGLEFGGQGYTANRFTLEDSENWYAWIEAKDSDSFVDLGDME